MSDFALLPLGRQADRGFAEFGSTYFRSAEILWTECLRSPYLADTIPPLFMYRHASELFLKSALSLLYQLPMFQGVIDDEAQTTPVARLEKTHSLIELAKWARSLQEQVPAKYSQQLHQFWGQKISPIDEIQFLSEWDEGSDYFRYPYSKSTARDLPKQGWIKILFDGLQSATSLRDPRSPWKCAKPKRYGEIGRSDKNLSVLVPLGPKFQFVCQLLEEYQLALRSELFVITPDHNGLDHEVLRSLSNCEDEIQRP